jgi:hypothetical protein
LRENREELHNPTTFARFDHKTVRFELNSLKINHRVEGAREKIDEGNPATEGHN